MFYLCSRSADDSDPDRPTDDWAAEHVRMLRELAELGMALARAAAGRALAQVDGADGDQRPVAAGGDASAAFTRIARCVRLTLALEARTREAVAVRQPAFATGPEMDAMAAKVRARLRAMVEPGVRGPRQAAVRRIVEEALEAEHAGPLDTDDLNERIDRGFDRLDAEDTTGFGFLRDPTAVLVVRICRDLGLQPDWSRWSDEPWVADVAKVQAREPADGQAAHPFDHQGHEGRQDTGARLAPNPPLGP